MTPIVIPGSDPTPDPDPSPSDGSAPCSSICTSWTTPEEITACGGSGLDETLLEEMGMVASEILFELSRRKYPGSCADTVRPCSTRLWDESPTYYTGTHWDGRAWHGRCSCSQGSCSCMGLRAVSLGVEPVTSITQVLVDGEVLDLGDYKLLDWRLLVMTGDSLLPCCQDLSLPSTEPGTFEVSFTYGKMPPKIGRLAASKLALEMARACSGGECELPERVQTITRQDVTIAVLDPFSFLEKGRTGIYLVDLFLEKESRGHGRSGVLNPDLMADVVRETG